MPSEQNPIWAALVPELAVTDLTASLAFYVDIAGFSVKFARSDPPFAYLEREAAQIMLEQRHAGEWATAEMHHPYGRGVNFQIETLDADRLAAAFVAAGIRLFRNLTDRWYSVSPDHDEGQREFLVQDPDGYLLRFVQPLGVSRRDETISAVHCGPSLS